MLTIAISFKGAVIDQFVVSSSNVVPENNMTEQHEEDKDEIADNNPSMNDITSTISGAGRIEDDSNLICAKGDSNLSTDKSRRKGRKSRKGKGRKKLSIKADSSLSSK